MLEVARKQRKPDHKRVSARLAELRQQEHRIQMGHVVALGVELRGTVHDVLQDAEKFRYDLFPAGHGRFDCGSRELSGRSFELVQDLGYFHANHPIGVILVRRALRYGGAWIVPLSYEGFRVPKLCVRPCWQDTIGLQVASSFRSVWMEGFASRR